MGTRGKVDWDGARLDFESAGCTRAAVARKYAITYSELMVHAKINKWSDAKRNSSTDRLVLMDRLMGIIELQIDHLETCEMTPSGEKEVAVLGKLTSTLGTLIGFARAEANDPGRALETAEMREIREQLAKRIDALTKG